MAGLDRAEAAQLWRALGQLKDSARNAAPRQKVRS
jgi:hypothetical protein